MSSNSDSYLLKMGVGEVGDVSDSINMTGMTFLGTATRLTVQMINPPILLGIYQIMQLNRREIKLQVPEYKILVPGSMRCFFVLSLPPVIYSCGKLTPAL